MLTIKTPTKEMVAHFTRLVADMHPELLRRSIRNALNREGRKLASEARMLFPVAARNAGYAGVGRQFDKSIAHALSRDYGTLMVRVYFSGRRAFVRSSGSRREVPLAHWLEMGSFRMGDRMTRGGSRRAHRTGELAGIHALELLESKVSPSDLEGRLVASLEKASENIIRKYGL